MNWINAKERKPEGEVFWALTSGRYEQGYRDWQIIRLWNNAGGDYRTLDYAGAYRLDSVNPEGRWDDIIYAWLPLKCIPINDNIY